MLKQTIEQRLGVQVYLVDETPMPGLYLLGTAQGLLYSDARGDYVLQGSMLDLAHDMRNLTRLSQQQQRRLALSQIGRPGPAQGHPLKRHPPHPVYRSPAVLPHRAGGVAPFAGEGRERATAACACRRLSDQASWCDPGLLRELNFGDRLPKERL